MKQFHCFSPLLNLVGIFTHHFFALNIFVETSAGLLKSHSSNVGGTRAALRTYSTNVELHHTDGG